MTDRKLAHFVGLVVLAVGVAACSSPPAPTHGSSAPSGATAIPGGPMEPTPTASSPKIPTSQQEAQDTIVGYMQKTLAALPPGTSLDGTRYAVGDGTTYCEDDPSGDDSPVHVEDWRDFVVPSGADVTALVGQTGDIWKQWGWQVIERDGFSKPNRFGYSPDGYVLQIEARPDAKYPPSLVGSSPCFSGSLRHSGTVKPPVIQQK